MQKNFNMELRFWREFNMLTAILVISFTGMVSCHPHYLGDLLEPAGRCGYPSCPTPIPGKLNVHLVPHSHDDVGWLKTVDQYYYGSATHYQNAGVQYILDSVVQELAHDPEKKFIYVETAFFWKWWLEQDDHMKHLVKRLVANGQLEFIGGAWSMNDEATTHYQSVIDQFTWGFRKLNDTFGYCGQPKVGWQIDPFGHSRETASLMAQMGFDGLFFGRLDYQDKRKRLLNKTMEMIWEGSDSLGEKSELFTGALYNFYSAPEGFCFDILCDDDPIIDNRKSPEYNVDKYVDAFKKFADKQSDKGDLFTSALYNEYAAPPGFCFDVLCQDEPIIENRNSSAYNLPDKVSKFLYFLQKMARGYESNNLLVTMGEDFQYQAAHHNYKNMDLLIRQTKRKTLSFVRWCFLPDFQPLRRRNSGGRREQPHAKWSNADIFTGVLYHLYQAPPGFCFDIMCGDEPMIDDKNSQQYNVDKRVNQFIKFVNKQRMGYLTENILVTMGGDFNYLDAQYYYKNLEKLVRYVNERQANGSNINVFYSTPSCYVKSLNEANIYWPTKKDDFFPYASDQHSYWTGYFTSRPTLKYFERLGNNYLQICKQLSAMTHLGPDYDLDVSAMREAMGIMQHHDAITGTEKQHVANDYARILSEGFEKCGIVINEALNRIVGQGEKNPARIEMKSCLLTNVSECSVSSESRKFLVTVYNPLSRPVDYFVRLPVYASKFSVRDPQGNELDYQIVPIPEPLNSLPGRTAQSDHELVFKAKLVPPLGYRSYFISKQNSLDDIVTETPETADTHLSVTEDGYIIMRPDSDPVRVKPSVHYYIGEFGSNLKPERRSSGAYIFRPKGTDPIDLKILGNNTYYRGKIVTELHQTYTNWTSHVIRQYADESYLEVEWMVGPIPISDWNGKEVVWRYTTPDIDSKETFFTDTSGRETLERVKDYRPTWDLVVNEPVSGNYYPITTDISISNENDELTVIVDRAQGGTSLKSGQIELMVHRRLLHDDAFGVGEPLNETAFGKGLVARGRHWILLGKRSDADWAKRKRHLQQQKVLDSHLFLTPADSIDFDEWSLLYQMEFSGLKEALPGSVQILTLEPWKNSNFLLRLEHIFQKNESQEEVTVNLGNLFVSFDIVSIRETTLGGNQWLDEAKRLKWKKETNEVGDGNEAEGEEIEWGESEKNSQSFEIKLRPKEIRTFICNVKPKAFVAKTE